MNKDSICTSIPLRTNLITSSVPHNLNTYTPLNPWPVKNNKFKYLLVFFISALAFRTYFFSLYWKEWLSSLSLFTCIYLPIRIIKINSYRSTCRVLVYGVQGRPWMAMNFTIIITREIVIYWLLTIEERTNLMQGY